MKKTLLTRLTFAIVLFTLAIAYTGCTVDVDAREKFVGSYASLEDCEGGSDSYISTIQLSTTDDSEITLAYLYFSNVNLTATVAGDQFIISPQIVEGNTFSGTGKIDGNVITLDYNIRFSFGSELECRNICTKL